MSAGGAFRNGASLACANKDPSNTITAATTKNNLALKDLTDILTLARSVLEGRSFTPSQELRTARFFEVNGVSRSVRQILPIAAPTQSALTAAGP
jgi:hypothetical protein